MKNLKYENGKKNVALQNIETSKYNIVLQTSIDPC